MLYHVLIFATEVISSIYSILLDVAGLLAWLEAVIAGRSSSSAKWTIGLGKLGVSGERLLTAKRINTSQKHLELAESSAGGVLRDHVSRQRNSNVSQTALAVSSAKHASTSQSGKRSILVVGDVERLDGRSLESQLTAESHVLDGQQGAVGDEHHVEGTVADDDILGLVDDMGQNLVGGSV